jgi:anaerobic selenocysteine-containing dehydrogenase
MTSPVYKSALPTVSPEAKYPILSKLPKFKEWCLADVAFDEVIAHPEGAVIGMADQDHMMEKHVVHKDRKMHLWCQEIEDYLNEYITPEAEAEALRLKDGNNLYLSSGYRYEAGVNNAMRNPGVNKYRKVWSLLMNPEDAKDFGFEDGETIKLSTNRGSIEIPVEYSWRASRGYCLMPHHFGNHYQGKKLYMNANFLTDRKAIDKLTGNSEWRQTPCRVEKLAK